MLGAHGVRGELKCRLITDFPKRRFRRGAHVFLKGQEHVVQTARIQGDTVLLKLEAVDDRDVAMELRGADVEIPATDTPPLPRGQYYWHQVIGLRVEMPSGEVIGEVKDILETGANDVYVVRTEQGREVLVPAIKDVVKEIDPVAGRMLIEPLPGLLPGA